MLELKLRRVGNSLGLILPSEVISALHVKEGDSLFANVQKDKVDTIELTAINPRQAEILEAAEEGRQKFRHSLKALAKR